MKTEIFNPWPIIRWSAVALLYAGTVAVAVDQVKTKDRALADFSQKLEAAKKEARAANSARERSGKQAVEIERLTQQITTLEAGKEFDANVLQRMALKVVAAERKLAESQAAPVGGASTVSYTNSPQQMAAAPVIPAWFPPAPSVVTKTIRDRAVAEHKDNFSSLNYEIERQTEAFDKIVRYYKTADPFIKSAINKAALEYGANYSSFAYDVERQIEARQKFQAR